MSTHQEPIDYQCRTFEFCKVQVFFRLVQPLKIGLFHSFNLVPGDRAPKVHHSCHVTMIEDSVVVIVILIEGRVVIRNLFMFCNHLALFVIKKKLMQSPELMHLFSSPTL